LAYLSNGVRVLAEVGADVRSAGSVAEAQLQQVALRRNPFLRNAAHSRQFTNNSVIRCNLSKRATAFNEPQYRVCRSLGVGTASSGLRTGSLEHHHQCVQHLCRSRPTVGLQTPTSAYNSKSLPTSWTFRRFIELRMLEGCRGFCGWELMRGMPRKQYEVLALRDFVGLTFEEIGEELAIPVPTARKRYRLAWRRLQGARIRWQAVQRRKGYKIIPIAAASIMASKPA